MGNDLFLYLERLELMVFFVGYPLFFTLVRVIAGSKSHGNSTLTKLAKLLPLAYALCGTLYLGSQLKYLWPHLSSESISSNFSSWLKCWGLLALLFWIPWFYRRPILSLLHSLVIFFFLLKDLFLHSTSSANKEVIQNDMKIFTDSLLLNCFSFLVVIMFYYFYHFLTRKRKATN
ncbi:MAG TPA: hypothetical protein VMZ03_11460 [Chitinophagaceae bacterium]|nr:hypothetical protein [Chitinophagaceae bacterium]